MKPAREWKTELSGHTLTPDVELIPGREGDATLRVNNVYLHSRYNPREEAKRLVDSAELDRKRPVLAIGCGLGYHVLELLSRGMTVVVVEPVPSVARLAVEGPLRDSDALLGVGDVQAIAQTPAFRAYAERVPQILVHPPTAQLHPQYVAEMEARVIALAVTDRRLNIAVVGPMYGGSLPIAQCLERAFRSLGHRTLYVDNSHAYPLYQSIEQSVKTKTAARQLRSLLVNFLGQWNYAHVAEYAPDICIALAQAPVGLDFPLRLAQSGIITAFWYVENWRHMPYWKEVAPRYDTFFHIQPGNFEQCLTECGCSHHAFVQTGCDPSVHRPVELTQDERAQLTCDISFAGAGYPNRNTLFAGLTDYDFKIFGVDWSGREIQRFVQHPDKRFTPEDFAKIVAASKISLNLHSSTSHPGVDPLCDAINPRVFEIAACGGFQLCDPCIGLDRYFDFESELPVYRNLVELRAKIDYYLAHPEERAAIASRARERVLQEHTYERRAQQILDILLERHGARLLRKGVRAQRTIGEMVDRVGNDTELGRFLAKLPPDQEFLLENIESHIARDFAKRTFPESMFHYLAEMYRAAEAMLESRGM